MIPCPHCNDHFKNKNILSNHIKKRHNKNPKTPDVVVTPIRDTNNQELLQEYLKLPRITLDNSKKVILDKLQLLKINYNHSQQGHLLNPIEFPNIESNSNYQVAPIIMYIKEIDSDNQESIAYQTPAILWSILNTIITKIIYHQINMGKQVLPRQIILDPELIFIRTLLNHTINSKSSLNWNILGGQIVPEQNNLKLKEIQVYHAFVAKTVDAGWHGCCLALSIILHEVFEQNGIPNIVKRGFLSIRNKQKYSLQHYWVETPNGIYDVSTDSSQIIFPSFIVKAKNTFLSEEVLEDHKRIDDDTPGDIEQLIKNEKLWLSYNNLKDGVWNRRYSTYFEGGDNISFIKMLSFKNQMQSQIKNIFQK